MSAAIDAARAQTALFRQTGLGCVFRDWRSPKPAERFLRGASLEVRFEFGFTEQLGEAGLEWVTRFGMVRPMRAWLLDTFDGATLAAADDPDLAYFRLLDRLDLLRLVEVERTGCEAFAELVFDACRDWMEATGAPACVRLLAVECGVESGIPGMALGLARASS